MFRACTKSKKFHSLINDSHLAFPPIVIPCWPSSFRLAGRARRRSTGRIRVDAGRHALRPEEEGRADQHDSQPRQECTGRRAMIGGRMLASDCFRTHLLAVIHTHVDVDSKFTLTISKTKTHHQYTKPLPLTATRRAHVPPTTPTRVRARAQSAPLARRARRGCDRAAAGRGPTRPPDWASPPR